MDVDIPPTEYIQSLAGSADASLRPLLERMALLHEKKLWYQLTKTTQELLVQPASAPFQVDLWHHFISTFAKQVNQLRLAQIAVTIAQNFPSKEQGLQYLNDLAEQQLSGNENAVKAYVLVSVEAAHYQLLLGDVEGTHKTIQANEQRLDQLDKVDNVVHASFYRVSADLHKAKAEYSEFYNTSLLYLACVDIDSDLGPAQRVERAHDLAISALLGETIFNFGELLLHPILNSLEAPPNEWLRTTLFVFNEGAIGKFDALVPQFQKEPILQMQYGFLRQKICLMALIEIIFQKPAGNRILSFKDVATSTTLPVNEVEHLIMKALSLKLIVGTIDQVAQTFSVSWVQPRVLDKQQIGGMSTRLASWSDKVSQSAGMMLEGGGNELFAAA